MSLKEADLPENWEDEIDWGDEEEASEAAAASTSAGTTPSEAALPFHNVSPVKLAVLSFATFGTYQLVWFYKNWVSFHRYRKGEPRRLMALVRTVFSAVLYWDLAGQIDTIARKADAPGTTRPMLVGPLFLVMCWLWRLPEPYSNLSLLAFLPLLPASVQIARVHAALRPGVETRVGWGAGTWVALLVGALAWELVLTGMALEALGVAGS